MARACSGSRQARVTECPRSRSSHANALPQEPAPTTTARISLGASHEIDRDGDSLHLEALPELVLDPVAEVARDQSRVVHEEAEARRADAGLRRVEHVQALARARR